MRTAIVIPARYASSRLPAKPLLRETGKYLVQHVYERACESHALHVVVATDDVRIVQAVRSFGGRVVMTRADHVSGTGPCRRSSRSARRRRDRELARRRAADRACNARSHAEPVGAPSGVRYGHAGGADRLGGTVARSELRQGSLRCGGQGTVLQPQPDSLCPRRAAGLSQRAVPAASRALCLPAVVPAGVGKAAARAVGSVRKSSNSCGCWRWAGASTSASSRMPAAASIRRPTTARFVQIVRGSPEAKAA